MKTSLPLRVRVNQAKPKRKSKGVPSKAGIIGVEEPGDYANPIPTTSEIGPSRREQCALRERRQGVGA